MLKSLSTSMIVRGVLALAVGIIALAWPSVTVLTLVILFAIYAFIASGLEAMRAFSSAKAGPVIVHLLLALVDLAAGVVALAFPGRAEVSMLIAKNRRQPSSIRGLQEAGIGPGASSPRPIAPVTASWLDRAAEQTSPLSVLSLVQPPAAAPVKSLPLPSDRWRLLVSGRRFMSRDRRRRLAR